MRLVSFLGHFHIYLFCTVGVHFLPTALFCTVIVGISLHTYLADICELFIMRSFSKGQSWVIGKNIDFIVDQGTVDMDIVIAVLEGFHCAFCPIAHQTTCSLYRLQLTHLAHELMNAVVYRIDCWLEVVAALMDSDVTL